MQCSVCSLTTYIGWRSTQSVALDARRFWNAGGHGSKWARLIIQCSWFRRLDSASRSRWISDSSLPTDSLWAFSMNESSSLNTGYRWPPCSRWWAVILIENTLSPLCLSYQESPNSNLKNVSLVALLTFAMMKISGSFTSDFDTSCYPLTCIIQPKICFVWSALRGCCLVIYLAIGKPKMRE